MSRAAPAKVRPPPGPGPPNVACDPGQGAVPSLSGLPSFILSFIQMPVEQSQPGKTFLHQNVCRLDRASPVQSCEAGRVRRAQERKRVEMTFVASAFTVTLTPITHRPTARGPRTAPLPLRSLGNSFDSSKSETIKLRAAAELESESELVWISASKRAQKWRLVLAGNSGPGLVSRT
jgi:hypothetical protein